MVAPAGIHHRPGSTHGRPQRFGQVFNQVPVLRSLHTPAATDNNFRLGYVQLTPGLGQYFLHHCFGSRNLRGHFHHFTGNLVWHWLKGIGPHRGQLIGRGQRNFGNQFTGDNRSGKHDFAIRRVDAGNILGHRTVQVKGHPGQQILPHGRGTHQDGVCPDLFHSIGNEPGINIRAVFGQGSIINYISFLRPVFFWFLG